MLERVVDYIRKKKVAYPEEIERDLGIKSSRVDTLLLLNDFLAELHIPYCPSDQSVVSRNLGKIWEWYDESGRKFYKYISCEEDVKKAVAEEAEKYGKVLDVLRENAGRRMRVGEISRLANVNERVVRALLYKNVFYTDSLKVEVDDNDETVFVLEG